MTQSTLIPKTITLPAEPTDECESCGHFDFWHEKTEKGTMTGRCTYFHLTQGQRDTNCQCAGFKGQIRDKNNIFVEEAGDEQ